MLQGTALYSHVCTPRCVKIKRGSAAERRSTSLTPGTPIILATGPVPSAWLQQHEAGRRGCVADPLMSLMSSVAQKCWAQLCRGCCATLRAARFSSRHCFYAAACAFDACHLGPPPPPWLFCVCRTPASLEQLQVSYIDLVMVHHRACDISGWPRTCRMQACPPRTPAQP